MNIEIITLHANNSTQAVALAAGCLKASLPPDLQQSTKIREIYPGCDLGQLTVDILRGKPDLLAFPLYVWNRQEILGLTNLLRSQQKKSLFMVAGGPEASADPGQVLAEGELDAVICGEGELPFAQLATSLQQQKSLASIPGLVLSGQAQGPKAECLPGESLYSPWLSGQLSLTPGCGVLWEVARGCTFQCAFCYDAKGERGVRALPFARLQQELQLFRDKQVSQIWVLDSTFNAPAERGHKLLELLIATAPEIHYHIEAKADFLDQKTAELLAQLSCSVQIGLQSATNEVLKPLHRALQPQLMSRNLQLLTRAGVTFGLDLIYGLPGDNHQGFSQSLDFALQQQPNQVDIFPLAVLPGTELHEKKQQLGLEALAKPPYTLLSNSSYSVEDMRKSRQLAAATDIFYNRGRAVGFFMQLCQAAKKQPSQLLGMFFSWLEKEQKLSQAGILAVENWWPDTILPLQLAFAAATLARNRATWGQKAMADLIQYHYLCAQTVLTENCQAQTESAVNRNTRWQLNPVVKIHRFHHPVAELEMYGGEKLKVMAENLSQEKEYVIFMRQDDEFVVEALDDDFAAMLLAANGRKNRMELLKQFPGVSKEMISFAIDTGILLPAG